MFDDEPATGGLVFGLAGLYGAVHVVRVSAGGEDEKKGGQADEDVEERREGTLEALGTSSKQTRGGVRATEGGGMESGCEQTRAISINTKYPMNQPDSTPAVAITFHVYPRKHTTHAAPPAPRLHLLYQNNAMATDDHHTTRP